MLNFLGLQTRKTILSFVELAIIYLIPWGLEYNSLGGGGYIIHTLFSDLAAIPAGSDWDNSRLLLLICPLIAFISPLIEIYCLTKIRWLYLSKPRPKMGKKEFKEFVQDLRDSSKGSLAIAGINVLILSGLCIYVLHYGLPPSSVSFLIPWIIRNVLNRKGREVGSSFDEGRFPALPKSEGTVATTPKTDVQSTTTVATTQAEVVWRAPTASHVSEVERVTVWRHATYQAGRVRLETKVTNTSEVAVFRVQLSLFLGKAFRVLRIEPASIESEKLAVKLGELFPADTKQVVWILEPLFSGKQSVDGSVTGVDAGGKIFVKPLEPLEVKVECPTFVPPAEATLPALKQLVETLPAKSERVYYLPIGTSVISALGAAVKAFTGKNLRHVGTFNFEEGGDAGFDQTAWFYALSTDGAKKSVITSSISEQNHLIRIFAACEEEEGCMGFLAEAGPIIRQELVAVGVVDADSAILELVCERCGTPLPRGPINADDGVQCVQCKRIWYLHDLL